MFEDLEKILVFYKNLKKAHLDTIRGHDWISGHVTHCSKCKIEFLVVLHVSLHPEYNELTCDEVLIKKLLE